MDIASIVASFSHIRLATPADNVEILRFLKNQCMATTDFSIGFDRGSDFFKLYKLSSDRWFTFLFLNDDRSIGGMGTLLVQRLTLNGHVEQVGYFCDLRVDARASRTTHVQWRAFYAELVANLPKLESPQERCSFAYTSVFDSNQKAVIALTKKLSGVRYLPFHSYRTNTLLFDPLGWLPSQAAVSDEKIETTWWVKAAKDNSLAPASWMESGGVSGAAWPGWNKTPFVSIKDREGRCLAMCKPWSSDGIRDAYVSRLNPRLKTLGNALGIMRRPAIQEDRPLKQVFLTHLTFATELDAAVKHKALRQLVSVVYRQAVRDRVHLVSWIESGPKCESSWLDARVVIEIPAHLYEVVAAGAISRAEELKQAKVFFEGAIL